MQHSSAVKAMLRLPILVAAATLLVVGVAERLWLRPSEHSVAVVVGVHLVVIGTLVTITRVPVAALALIAFEIWGLVQLELNDTISTPIAVLVPFVAAFAAAALVPARWLWLVGAVIVIHMAWRSTLPKATVVGTYQDFSVFMTGLVTGALLHRRHRRLLEVRAERDRLVTALESGPGEAATAEQLRMWSLLEQRIEPVIDTLPDLVRRARDGTRERAAELLEAIRVRATDALAEIQATIHTLGAGEPPPPAPVEAAPPRAPGRTLSPLWVATGLLLVAAFAEMVAADTFSGYAIALALLPLLAPRAPVLTSVLVGLTAIVCSLDSGIPVAARIADFSTMLTLLVAGATASPRRATASFVLVVTGLLVSQGLDPTFDWPAAAFVGSALVYTTTWIFGVLLRGVAVEQRQVRTSLAEAAEAYEQLQVRAVKRERVRLAHELHDLVGHALTAVAIQAGAAKAQLKHGRAPAYELLASAAAQGASELQRLATVLGHKTDVVAELKRVTDLARATGQQVQLELDEPDSDLQPEVRHTVVCVAAEALTNAAKHASGATVRVNLKAVDDRLELAVVDSGGVARELPSGGRGTASMARRVRECGGTFASGPRPDGGWTVQAVLPLSV